MKCILCVYFALLFFSQNNVLFHAGNLLQATTPTAPQAESPTIGSASTSQISAAVKITPQAIPLTQPAFGVVSADFDNDGKADLAVLDSSGVTILLRSGAGSFQSVATYPLPHSFSLASGDFNQDGRADLAITRTNGTVSILLGNGDGTFQPPIDYAVGAGPQAIAIADFNRDGILDLVVANAGLLNGRYTGSTVSVLLGKGDGTFQPQQTFMTPPGPVSVEAVDLDGDGHLDLILATSGPFGTVSVLRGNGDGTFQPHEDLRTSTDPLAHSRTVLAADLNSDGLPDLIVVNNTSSGSGTNTEISVLLASALGTWQPPAVHRTSAASGGSSPRSQLLLVDLDADGRPDLVFVGNDQVSVEFGNPDATFRDPTFYPAPEATAGVLLNLDENGLQDLIVVGRSITILHTSPNVQLSAASSTFSPRQVRTVSPPLAATLRNRSNVPIRLSGFELSGDFSQANDCGNQLPPGSQCTVAVTFAPQAVGTRSGILSVLDSHAKPVSSISFAGEGVTSGPVVVLSPTSLMFTGVRVATHAAKTAQLTNTGTSSLTINSIAATGGNQFSVASNCGGSLAANASCTLTVTFSPSFPETQSGAISIADDASDSPQTIALTGSGESLAFSKTNLNFQPIPVGQTSASLQTVNLFNVGPGVVTFTAITVTGANASDFQWLPNSGPQSSCPFPGVLRAGDHCFISISFTPSAVGLRSATLGVSDDRDPSPVTIPITGTGKAVGPIVTFSSPSLSFGPVPAGSHANRTLGLTNSGDEVLSVTSVGTTAQFTQTNNCGTNLPAGATCQFTVTFSPTFGGAQSGALTVTDNAPGSPQSVTLDGTGQNIVFSKTSLVFPTVSVGETSATRSVSLFSLSGNAIVIGSLTGTNAGDFQVTSISCGPFGSPDEIRHGDPCIIELTFSPTAAGLRVAQLVFMNQNPSSGPSVILPLSANGT